MQIPWELVAAFGLGLALLVLGGLSAGGAHPVCVAHDGLWGAGRNRPLGAQPAERFYRHNGGGESLYRAHCGRAGRAGTGYDNRASVHIGHLIPADGAPGGIRFIPCG